MVEPAIPGTGIAGNPKWYLLGNNRCVWPTEVPRRAV